MSPTQISRTEPLGFLKHKTCICSHISLSGLKQTPDQHQIITRLWASGQKLITRRPTNYRKINMECYIRSKSDLYAMVQNNAPIPPGLNRDTTVCRIDITKVTNSVGEILRKKTIHTKLGSFIYDRRVLKTHHFDLVYWEGFEHMTKIVPNNFIIWVVNYVSSLCGTNVMKCIWKEVPNPGCPFCKHLEVKYYINFNLLC